MQKRRQQAKQNSVTTQATHCFLSDTWYHVCSVCQIPLFLRLVMPQLYRALQEPNSQISYHLRQHGQFHSMNCQKKFTFMLIDLAERSADVDVGRAHLAGRRMRTRRQTRRHALIPSDVVLVPPVAVLPLAVSARHRRCAPVTLVIVVYN